MEYLRLFSTLSLGIALGALQAADTLTDPPKIYYYTPEQNDFYTQGDVLIWQPYTQDSLSWVDLRTIDVNPDNDTRRFDDFRSMHYGWEAGFRVLAGYRFGKNALGASVRPWQFEASYTQLIADATDAIPVQSGVSQTNFIIAPLPPVDNSSVEYTYASSVIDLSYRHLKAEFSWPIWPSQNIIWRLRTGASYAWFKNFWNSVYSGPVIGSVESGKMGNDYSDFSWNFKGGGLFAGTDCFMGVGGGFGFFASGAIDLLVGRVALNERYRYFGQRDTDPVLHVDKNYMRTFTRVQPAFSFGAGVDYKRWFSKNRFMTYVSVGYDWMLWWNLNQFGKVNERDDTTTNRTAILMTTEGNFFDAEPSSLGFQGATVRFGLEF